VGGGWVLKTQAVASLKSLLLPAAPSDGEVWAARDLQVGCYIRAERILHPTYTLILKCQLSPLTSSGGDRTRGGGDMG
jgi:hypothetical protein